MARNLRIGNCQLGNKGKAGHPAEKHQDFSQGPLVYFLIPAHSAAQALLYVL
jgi:hypothetical protein